MKEKSPYVKIYFLYFETLNEEVIYSLIQEEVQEIVGVKALELGLLFGIEIPQREEMDALCFLHLMLQEFAAGVFVSRQDRVYVLVYRQHKHTKRIKV